MKTLEYIIENHKSECIDGRDMTRLMQFVKEEDLGKIGVTLKDEYVGTHEAIPFTRENILKQLKEDVLFGWEKAVNERGISASLMYEVVQMWNWVLEEGLEDYDNYGWYGKPLFIKTAEKYGWKDELDF
jgi:hypothetical protein